jgi:hypothetical protein
MHIIRSQACYVCPRSDTQLTYMIDIALTGEFALVAVCDERQRLGHGSVDLVR